MSKKYPFDEIVIIYNPNSTGNSEDNAKALAKELRAEVPRVSVRLRKTTHAGHAKEIGEKYAAKDANALLVSSSGDGGYNELVNGVLAHKTKRLAVAVLPSGNANDHHHATAEASLLDRITIGEAEQIDVLKIEGVRNGRDWQHYAHSYVGLGLTAYIGRKLTEAELNPLLEKWLVVKNLFTFNHITVRPPGAGQWQRYQSIVFANISRMSKVLKMPESTDMKEGELEMYTIKRRSLVYTLSRLLATAAVGDDPAWRGQKYSLEIKRAIEVQCDGEVFRLDGGTIIEVRVLKRVLRVLSVG